MKKLLSLFAMVIMVTALVGCEMGEQGWDDLKAAFKGRAVTIQTFDENSQVIDQVHGKSVNISRDSAFDSEDSDGKSKKDSSVLEISVGEHMMHHVGSSLLMYEDGLHNIMTDENVRVDIENSEKGSPIINSIVHDYKNFFTGKSRVIMIRSQNGTPLAVFSGNQVSSFPTDVQKTTGLRIDDKYLFIYKCDYTIYDVELLGDK